MKKFFAFLLCILALPFLSGASGTPLGATAADGFSSFSIYPLGKSGTETKIQIGYVKQNVNIKTVKVQVYIINDLYPSGKKIFERSNSPKATLTYSETYDNSYTRSSNKVRLVVTSTARTIDETHDVSYASSKNVRVSGETYTYTPTLKKLTYSQKSGWSETNESYTIHTFGDEYVPDYYHNFKLDNFIINGTGTFGCSSAKLFLTNRDGLFNDMPLQGSNVAIPLELEYVLSGKYKLIMPNEYYVDPVTLLMSETPKPGYVQTNYIYFPRNEMRYQGEYVCQIVLENFGYEFAKLIYSFKINALINLVGDCYNSEYCVINEDAEVNEDYGWSI